MKKGFTLAEMLVTLSIIGVIAVMTLPTLQMNVDEAKAKTALKKAITTLTQVATANSVSRNYDYATITNTNNETFVSMLEEYANISSSEVSADGASASASTTSTTIGTISFDSKITFRDGSTIYYNVADTGRSSTTQNRTTYKKGDTIISATAYNALTKTEQSGYQEVTSTAKVGDIADDGLPNGFYIVYDINGSKAPNVLSNCSNNLDATIEDTQDETASACTKSNKVIKDRFLLRLRGTTVEPEGGVASYLYNS